MLVLGEWAHGVPNYTKRPAQAQAFNQLLIYHGDWPSEGWAHEGAEPLQNNMHRRMPWTNHYAYHVVHV